METLSVTLQKQPWRCVLDPVLMLCSSGLESIYLTQQLGNVVELWVFRELFHILDDTPLYLNPTYYNIAYGVGAGDDELHRTVRQQPASSTLVHMNSAEDPRACGASSPLIDQRSLNAWEQIRRTTDLGGYQFYWVGDAVSQSRLPQWLQRGETTNRRLQSYELLAQSLEAQSLEAQSPLSQSESDTTPFQQPLFAACRDAAALTAALGSAFVLAAQHSPQSPPYLVHCLSLWGIPCQQLPATDAIAGLEQNLFHQLFVEAGLTKLLWSKKLHLAIVHLSVPAAFDPGLIPEGTADDTHDDGADFDCPWELENIAFPPLDANPWEGAQVYWYPLTHHSVMPSDHVSDASSLTR